MSTWRDLFNAWVHFFKSLFRYIPPQYVMNDGKEICCCGDCTNNTTIPGAFPGVPTHKCILLSDETGNLRTIFSPIKLLDECPLPKSGDANV